MTTPSTPRPSLGERRAESAEWRGIGVAFVVLLVGLIGTFWGWRFADRALVQAAQGRLEETTRELQVTIEKRLSFYLDFLRGFQGLYAASQQVDRDEFAAYYRTRRLQDETLGIFPVGFIERVAAADKAAFIDRIRHDTSMVPTGYPNFKIFPDGDRPEYDVVAYVEPYAEYRQGLGYDAASEPKRRAALEQARDTGEPAATEPITLVVDTQDHPTALMIVLPVYRNGAPHATVEERRAAVVGFVSGAFRCEQLFSSILHAKSLPAELDVEIFDGGVLSEEHLLFDAVPQELEGVSSWAGRIHRLTSLEIAGRSWTVSFSAPLSFGLQPVERLLPLFLLWVGVLLSTLLFGVLYSLSSSRLQAVKLAQRMTGDLRESERRYAELIEGAPDPMITVDVLGRLRSMNPAAECISGYQASELLGKHFLQTGVLSTACASKALQEFALLLAGNERPPVEYEMLRKDGSRFVVEANPCPIRRHGRIDGIQIIFRDMTERKRLEEQMRTSAQQLEEKTQLLQQFNLELTTREHVMQSLLEDLQAVKERTEQQANQVEVSNTKLREMAVLKDEFVAKVSHELRTPLTSIKEGLSLMLDGALGAVSPDQQDFLQTMDGDIDRLTDLINNMLDISKIEAGRMRLSRTRLDLRTLIQSLTKSYQPILGTRSLRTEFAEVPPAFADENRMLQVLTNLLSNAIKFSPEDGVITFHVERRDGMVAVGVEDRGPGIAPNDLPRLFQKFSQVGPQGAGRLRGTGLGLVVCKELAELHGGRIEVASMVGQGTTFTVFIPVYTDTLALSAGVQELLASAQGNEGEGVGLIAMNVEALLQTEETANGESRWQQLEHIAADVRRHVHRSDMVLALEPCWVVVLALVDANGAQAIVKRLQQMVSGGGQVQFGMAFASGQEMEPAMALFERARSQAATVSSG